MIAWRRERSLVWVESAPPTPAREQRPQTREGRDHVAAHQRLRHHRAYRVQKHVDLGIRRVGDLGKRPVGRDVGQPDVGAPVRSGHGEDEPAVRARHRHRERNVRFAHARRIDDQVASAARPQMHVGVEIARPDADGADDGSRADLDLLSRDGVAKQRRRPAPGALRRGSARLPRDPRPCAPPRSRAGRRR